MVVPYNLLSPTMSHTQGRLVGGLRLTEFESSRLQCRLQCTHSLMLMRADVDLDGEHEAGRDGECFAVWACERHRVSLAKGSLLQQRKTYRGMSSPLD